jgi:hypothetical protein
MAGLYLKITKEAIDKRSDYAARLDEDKDLTGK